MMSRNMVKSKASSVQPSQAANQASHWSLVGSFHHGTGESEAPAVFVMAFLDAPWNSLRATPPMKPRERAGQVSIASIEQTNKLLGLMRTDGRRFVRKWPTRAAVVSVLVFLQYAIARLAPYQLKCEELTQ